MNAVPESRAAFGAIDLVDEPSSTASQQAERVASDKPFRSIFVITFVVSAAAATALWIAFLIWLVIRVIF